LENTAGIDAGLAVRVGKTASIAHQAAGRGELVILVDRGHLVAERQGAESFIAGREEYIAGDHERAGAQSDRGCEGVIDLAVIARSQDMHLQPKSASRRLHVSRYSLGNGAVRVDKQ